MKEIIMQRQDKRKDKTNDIYARQYPASLTLEASLVMPIFLFLILAFLYFIQIFTVQEQIQSAISKMGLDLAKLTYIYQDFANAEDIDHFDQTIFDLGTDIELSELVASSINGSMLKMYMQHYLNMDSLKGSCIKDGFEGISFYHSKVLDDMDCIDIVVCYQIQIPVRLLPIDGLNMVQGVRLRGWTGHSVASAYTVDEEKETDE
ncbi:MAG: pilus assembly protein, partial [Clostridiales bacterium]|nr:pilus assembly protein [Clostridiales bacterium]